jgi:PHD/YefM family antitoxin component YafN of YafNO toxin-antitoxin module
MVVQAIKKEVDKKVKVNVFKIVKTSFDFTIEEVLTSIEDNNEKPVVNYISPSYYRKLDELDQELSNSYHMGRNYEAITKKELLLIIDKVVTKTPELFYNVVKLTSVIEDDYFIGVYETNKELAEYLDIINARDLALMGG